MNTNEHQWTSMNTIENQWNPVKSIEISFKKIGVVSYFDRTFQIS